MVLIQLTGLSGAGKTSVAMVAAGLLESASIPVEVIDGDFYRATLCKDLGFSKADRFENIRRLGKLASGIVAESRVAIIAAINPYEEIRNELKEVYNAKTVWVNCSLEVLMDRDTKGLYRRALLPDEHPEKLHNLTGIGDIYEEPVAADLILQTDNETLKESGQRLANFIKSLLNT